jgi:hypothetical protein
MQMREQVRYQNISYQSGVHSRPEWTLDLDVRYRNADAGGISLDADADFMLFYSGWTVPFKVVIPTFIQCAEVHMHYLIKSK